MSTNKPNQRMSDIEPSRLAQLNQGTAEAATLTECLAVNFALLMRSVVPEVAEDAFATMQEAAGEGITRRMSLAARLILQCRGMAAVETLQHHPSDTVRGWACFMIGEDEGHSLSERLCMIRTLADDHHFGVREWAWLAVRPHIADSLHSAVEQLASWTAEPSERLRRFACEATRPRGVWCKHLKPLRQQPEIALPVLEPLRADPAPYVQDSVGNWLNDASKDQPDWVQDLCARWSIESSAPATARICKRALRTTNRIR